MSGAAHGAGAGPLPGTLFVVATPIGNLGDLSARAVETLQTCEQVLAEDTRRARQLLAHFRVAGKIVTRFDAHSSDADRAGVVSRLLTGAQIALVTDAGTPGVSDPGERMVEAAVAAGVRVVPIPGASAVLAALVASGLAGDGRFRFVGFLPRGGRERHEALGIVSETPEPVVLFESPKRARDTLVELADACPGRPACVARELTKLHEEFTRGTLRELASSDRIWLGEIAIVLGAHDPSERRARVDDAELDARIDAGLASGEHSRTLADKLTVWSGRPKRDLYERIIERKEAERAKVGKEGKVGKGGGSGASGGTSGMKSKG